ncbi:hypothetical protein ABZP36_021962 [Zizania latifolia]
MQNIAHENAQLCRKNARLQQENRDKDNALQQNKVTTDLILATGSSHVGSASITNDNANNAANGHSSEELDGANKTLKTSHRQRIDDATMDAGDESQIDGKIEKWLLSELWGTRPLLGVDLPKTDEVNRRRPRSARSASSPAVVQLPSVLRVVPLFEKLADLEAAPAAARSAALLDRLNSVLHIPLS